MRRQGRRGAGRGRLLDALLYAYLFYTAHGFTHFSPTGILCRSDVWFWSCSICNYWDIVGFCLNKYKLKENIFLSWKHHMNICLHLVQRGNIHTKKGVLSKGIWTFALHFITIVTICFAVCHYTIHQSSALPFLKIGRKHIVYQERNENT